jgi:AbrB family looped-hinge helix DNA binding protein
MEISKISSKGQVVIPKEIRDLAGLKEGDAIVFKIADKVITIEKIDENVGTMADLLKKGNAFQKHLVKNLREEWD